MPKIKQLIIKDIKMLLLFVSLANKKFKSDNEFLALSTKDRNMVMEHYYQVHLVIKRSKQYLELDVGKMIADDNEYTVDEIKLAYQIVHFNRRYLGYKRLMKKGAYNLSLLDKLIIEWYKLKHKFKDIEYSLVS